MAPLNRYNCLHEVDRKMKQVAFLYNKLLKFQNKIFVFNGLDKKSGCYPIEVYFNSFIIFARSIFQYAYTQAKECDKIKEYNSFVSDNQIIKLFKNLRDDEIHSFSIESATTIYLDSPFRYRIDKNGNKEYTEYGLKKLKGEPSKPKPPRVEYYIRKRVLLDSVLLDELIKNGETKLIEEATMGNTIFQEIQLNGEKELFTLVTQYYKAVKDFIEYGKMKGFIS